MILPIYLYGHPILREETEDIDQDYPNLSKLIDDMFETMYNASGIGLAAPQVGLNIRMFMIDLEPLVEDQPEYAGVKKVFINPKIIKHTEDEIKLEEGCLSIPGIHEGVTRPTGIRIKYMDENFGEHEEEYHDFIARVIQHEYDHIEGILFTDKISAVRKQLIKSKVVNIVKGKIDCGYRVVAAK